MRSSLHRTRNNTKNFTRNLLAGGILASTVASTDLIENLTTSLTQPTSNILKCMENTSAALSATLKNTSQGNLLHTTGNVVTLLPRLIGTGLEGSRKTVGHTTQYVSALNQTINNNMITLSHANNATFSTSEKTADIAHQEIHLKPSHNLERNGNHGLLNNKNIPKHKFTRWLGNVKNSMINPLLNIARIFPDTVGVVANRSRGVIDSVQKIGKDFKSAWSHVFTHGQTFNQKLKNIRNQGIVGSAKAFGNGITNLINEGIIKTGAGIASIGINTVGRMIGNTLLPLFSTKAGREQADNFFASKKRHQSFTHYHQSTPLSSTSIQNLSQSHNTNTTPPPIDAPYQGESPDQVKEQRETPTNNQHPHTPQHTPPIINPAQQTTPNTPNKKPETVSIKNRSGITNTTTQQNPTHEDHSPSNNRTKPSHINNKNIKYHTTKRSRNNKQPQGN